MINGSGQPGTPNAGCAAIGIAAEWVKCLARALVPGAGVVDAPPRHECRG